jgi:hypothetical protein
MEHKLDEFVEKLKTATGRNLKAVVLYGSAASGEFHAGHSNVNTLCIMERTDPADLEVLQPAVAWWAKQGHPAPLVFTLEELTRSADVFAIELLDMKAHHRILFGEDIFAGLTVPLRYHRLQVERELRTNWLKLRQTILAMPKTKRAQLELMLRTVSSFTALFRHALIALGEAPAQTKREAIERAAKLTGSDASGFETILDLREGKTKEKDMDAEQTLRRYFQLVEAITNEVDRKLDATN